MSQLLSPKIIRAREGGCLELRGETRHQLLDVQGAFSLSHSHFEVGAGSPLHANSRQNQWCFVLRGEFCFRANDAQMLRAGDCAFAPFRVPCQLVCEAEEGGELLLGSVTASSGSTSGPKIVRAQDGECLEAFGECARVVISSPSNRFCLIESKTPSFCGPPLHVHEREDEVFFIRAGCFEFQLGDARVQAHPGDCVFAPRGVPHSFRVVSNEPGRALNFFVPGGYDAFLRECTRLFERGDAEPQLIERISASYGIRFLPMNT